MSKNAKVSYYILYGVTEDAVSTLMIYWLRPNDVIAFVFKQPNIVAVVFKQPKFTSRISCLIDHYFDSDTNLLTIYTSYIIIHWYNGCLCIATITRYHFNVIYIYTYKSVFVHGRQLNAISQLCMKLWSGWDIFYDDFNVKAINCIHIYTYKI